MVPETETVGSSKSTALAGWREGAAKQAIFDFVARTCEGADAVPVEERVAVFDNDGTLWCEKPMPIQLDFILRRLVEMAEADAGAARSPALEGGLRARLRLARRGDGRALRGRRHATCGSLAGGILAAYDGNQRRGLRGAVGRRSCAARSIRRSAAATSSAPTRRWSSCSAYLEANGFTNYIVSGGGRDFMRPISQEVYGIPRERVIGSASALAYTSDDRGGTITHKAEADYLDDGPQKPIRIWSRIGRRPLLAAGNSNGDIPMLEFTQHADKPSLRLLVLHDDAEREFDYTAGAEQALERAGKDGWTVVSVKNDWATVF